MGLCLKDGLVPTVRGQTSDKKNVFANKFASFVCTSGSSQAICYMLSQIVKHTLRVTDCMSKFMFAWSRKPVQPISSDTPTEETVIVELRYFDQSIFLIFY